MSDIAYVSINSLASQQQTVLKIYTCILCIQRIPPNERTSVSAQSYSGSEPQSTGIVPTQNSITLTAPPKHDGACSTYFEQKILIPEDGSQVTQGCFESESTGNLMSMSNHLHLPIIMQYRAVQNFIDYNFIEYIPIEGIVIVIVMFLLKVRFSFRKLWAFTGLGFLMSMACLDPGEHGV